MAEAGEIGRTIARIGTHNAYHIGQIIEIRKLRAPGTRHGVN